MSAAFDVYNIYIYNIYVNVYYMLLIHRKIMKMNILYSQALLMHFSYGNLLVFLGVFEVFCRACSQQWY